MKPVLEYSLTVTPIHVSSAATAVTSNFQGFSIESKNAMFTDNEVSRSYIAAQGDEPADDETEKVNVGEIDPEEVK